jgi:DNA-binding CsgD family transcriptional regulator
MGYTNKEVSDQLGLSVQTVKNHQTASFAQLDVQGLVMALRALGWVVLPDDDVLRPSSIRRQRV